MIITGLTMRNGRLVELRGNKFGAKKESGFDSRGERTYAAELDIQLRAGILTSVQRQVTFPLAVNGKHITNHRVDFVVEHVDGRREVIEYKGFVTEVWRIKRKLFEALYPDIPYTVAWHKKGRR